MSGLWCVNAGYGRQELVDAATEQMQELPYYNSFFQCSHPPAIELSAMLQDIGQSQLNRIFFPGSGSESNDTIVRMVRTYWDLIEQPKRHTIISRKNSYHGSTVAAASLGGMKAMHKQSGLPIPGIVHVEQPYWFGSDKSMSPDEFGIATARSIEDKIKEVGADKVAAWFLDSDYDGRCFCVTQAFFPNQKAWDKIAKALGSSADADAFAAYDGTFSVPFEPG